MFFCYFCLIILFYLFCLSILFLLFEVWEMCFEVCDALAVYFHDGDGSGLGEQELCHDTHAGTHFEYGQ